jgi:hypothetical protein
MNPLDIIYYDTEWIGCLTRNTPILTTCALLARRIQSYQLMAVLLQRKQSAPMQPTFSLLFRKFQPVCTVERFNLNLFLTIARQLSKWRVNVFCRAVAARQHQTPTRQ